MKKIIVIGSSGAGKSTFSRRLGAATGLEVIHLDKLHWKPDWTETPKDEWRKIVERIVQGDSWIIDGNFGGTLEPRFEACDTVIFLEMPRALCVYRVLKRLVTYRRGSRPDMADGCDEKFDWQFLKWVWNFPASSQWKIEKMIERFQDEKTIIRLRSRRDVENFLVKFSPRAVKSERPSEV